MLYTGMTLALASFFGAKDNFFRESSFLISEDYDKKGRRVCRLYYVGWVTFRNNIYIFLCNQGTGLQ